MFLSEADAPRAVFPDADRIERSDIVATEALREKMRAHLGSTAPSIWEPRYPTFTAWRGDVLLGRAFLVEEIGKHRPITFVVGVRADGSVQDVAVVAYREAYGGEIRHPRFLAQYRKKGPGDSLQPGSDDREYRRRDPFGPGREPRGEESAGPRRSDGRRRRARRQPRHRWRQ